MKIKKTVNILISCMTIWILVSWLLLTMITLNASAEAPGIVSGETYWIVNAHSGKVLDARNNGTTSGTNVIQWQNKNASNQKWQVTYNSSGDYYTIRPTHTSGLYLSADSTTLSNGVNACIKTGSSSNAARWKIEKITRVL